MKTRTLTMSLALLVSAFISGCQEQASSPVGPYGPQFHHSPSHDKGGGKNDDGETFDFFATVSTVGGSGWTNGAQEVRSNNAKNWLHIFDSGGAGTRGNPNYDNAAFNTKIFFAPGNAASCVDQDGMPSLNSPLFGKLNQDSFLDRVFDFQIGYDLATNPTGFLFFLFRWEDGNQIFSVEIGAFPAGDSDRASIAFLGDGDDGSNDPDLIDDPTKTRIFRISGGKVIAHELDKKKVIATLACDNDHIIEVTVIPK